MRGLWSAVQTGGFSPGIPVSPPYSKATETPLSVQTIEISHKIFFCIIFISIVVREINFKLTEVIGWIGVCRTLMP